MLLRLPSIVLNDRDVEFVLSVARLHHLGCINRKSVDPLKGDENKRWDHHIEGAGGECALAKILGNFFWDGSDKPGTQFPDVGPYFVRTTDHPNGCLMLHPDDPNNGITVLMVGRCPKYRVGGWILNEDGKLKNGTIGRDGKPKEYWRDPTKQGRPAFFVPQSDLNKEWPPPDPAFYLARRLQAKMEGVE